MHDARRDLTGITRFQSLIRLPIDQKIELAFQDIARLNSSVKARTSKVFLSIDCFLFGTTEPSSAAVPGKTQWLRPPLSA